MDPLFNGHTVIAYEGANDTSLLKNVKVNTDVKIENAEGSFDDSFWNKLLS
jgi:hypothetical protein